MSAPLIDEKFIIKDLETLKVVADALRIRIIEFFSDGQIHTVKQVSAALDVPPNKLYYHINMLEEFGLLRVADTRIVSGIIEKLYITAAHHISIEQGLLSPSSSTGDEGLALAVDTLFEDNRQALLDSVRAGLLKLGDTETPGGLAVFSLSLTLEQAKSFSARLQELLKEYDCLADQDDAAYYRLFHAFFPVAYASVDDDDPTG